MGKKRYEEQSFFSGSASVEMALTLPLVFALCFAAVEFGRVNMIRNSMENAAYEGAREGIVPGATAADCENAATSLLTAVGIQDFDVNVTPTVIQDDTPEVTVTITVQLDANSFVANSYFAGETMTRSSTLSREVR